MKKNILSLLFLIIYSVIFSQEKRIDFSKKLVYGSKNDNASNYAVYSSKNNEILTRFEYGSGYLMTFSDELGTSLVNFDMNNRLAGSFLSPYEDRYDDAYFQEKKKVEMIYEKLNTKETILGYTCENYLISFKSDNTDSIPEKIQVCVDDKNTINTVPLLSIMLYQDYDVKIKNNLSGLILKLGANNESDKETVLLKSINDTKDFVYFDHKKSKIHQKKIADSLALKYKADKEEYKKYTDSAGTAVTDSAVYNSAVGAAKAASNVPYVEADDVYLPKYESTYKNTTEKSDSNLDLAILSIENEKDWAVLPAYCRNLDKNLPQFSNPKDVVHLKNYVGQICDLYYTEKENSNVYKKGTVDEIRREMLYLNEKLNKKDLKKLYEYLNHLD